MISNRVVVVDVLHVQAKRNTKPTLTPTAANQLGGSCTPCVVFRNEFEKNASFALVPEGGWLTRLVHNGYNGQRALLCHVGVYKSARALVLPFLVPL